MSRAFSADVEATTRLSRISRVSRVMTWATLACIGLFTMLAVAGLVLTWQDRGIFESVVRDILGITDLPVRYTTETWALTAMFGAAPFGVLFFALWQGVLLFRSFAKGAVLVPQVSSRLQRMGLAIAILSPVQIVSQTLAILALSLGNAPGQRQLSIGVNGDQIVLILFGMLLLILGWAMGEAAQMADEHRHIV